MSIHEVDVQHANPGNHVEETSQCELGKKTQAEHQHSSHNKRRTSSSKTTHDKEKVPTGGNKRISILLLDKPDIAGHAPPPRPDASSGSFSERRGRRRGSPYPKKVRGNDTRVNNKDAKNALTGNNDGECGSTSEGESSDIAERVPVIDSNSSQSSLVSSPFPSLLAEPSHSDTPSANLSCIGSTDEDYSIRSIAADSYPDTPNMKRRGRMGRDRAFRKTPSQSEPLAVIEVVKTSEIRTMGSYQMTRTTCLLTTQITSNISTTSVGSMSKAKVKMREGRSPCSWCLHHRRYATEIIRFAFFCGAAALLFKTTGIQIGDRSVWETASLILLLFFLLRKSFGPSVSRDPWLHFYQMLLGKHPIVHVSNLCDICASSGSLIGEQSTISTQFERFV